MKKTGTACLVAYLTLILHLPSLPQPFMTNVEGRNARPLDGRWEAIVDMFSCGEQMEVYKNQTAEEKGRFVEYCFDAGIRLDVPGDWNSQRPELKYYESTVWYKRDFDCTPSPDKRLFLYFGASNYRTDVYLNGEKLGSHEGGFTPFQFEISDKVRPGRNFIVVGVDNRRSPLTIPALKYDWWNYGGITRSVFLIETPRKFIEDYTVRLYRNIPDRLYAHVKIQGAAPDEKVNLSIPEAGFSATLHTGKNGEAELSAPVRLTLWSPENPKLYTVEIRSPYDTIREQIGFRTVTTEDGKILLNGKQIFLKGINCHDEIPQRMGRAFSESDARMLLGEVKALGCNFLRLTHYPASEEMVRMAERMGIMLWEEVPLWQKIAFSDPGTLPKANRMVTEMIARDKNRCAVIMWSVSNETAPGPDRNRVLEEMIRHCRTLDPSRLITTAFSHTTDTPTSLTVDDPVAGLVDVIGINKYYGWYIPWRCEPKDFVWNVRFAKPVIFSEFGSEALYGKHGDPNDPTQWNEEYQARNYRNNIAMLPNIPNLAGTTPWVLFDFRSPYRMNGKYQEEWNRKGLISDKGHRKMAWYVLKAYYDSIP